MQKGNCKFMERQMIENFLLDSIKDRVRFIETILNLDETLQLKMTRIFAYS